MGLFVGLTSLILLLCILMVVLLVLGADGAADTVKWLGVAVSILFMSLTAWMSKN